MVDIVDAQTRSRMMAGIRGRNTKPEVALRRALHARGYRYRLHVKELAGRPDFVLARYRVAVFVHGCFWHRHEGCRYSTTPATRPEFWQAKFKGNVARDRRHVRELRTEGWRVAIVWECSIKDAGVQATADRLTDWIISASGSAEIEV